MAKTAKQTAKTPVTGGNRPARVPLHTVMEVLRESHVQGDSDHFMEKAVAADAIVSIHPKTLDFVKKYIKKNNLQDHPAAKKVIVCPHPNKCPPVATD